MFKDKSKKPLGTEKRPGTGHYVCQGGVEFGGVGLWSSINLLSKQEVSWDEIGNVLFMGCGPS